MTFQKRLTASEQFFLVFSINKLIILFKLEEILSTFVLFLNKKHFDIGYIETCDLSLYY